MFQDALLCSLINYWNVDGHSVFKMRFLEKDAVGNPEAYFSLTLLYALSWGRCKYLLNLRPGGLLGECDCKVFIFNHLEL